MQRLFFVLPLFLALLPAASAQSHSPSPNAPRPNFLILFADDQRADTIAAWGNRHIRTPHIDSLVRQGVSFQQNYCFGSNSGAVCIPSRAMLMSGRTWLQSPNSLTNVTLFPQLFSQHGYTTFATGKWHNGQNSFTRAFQTGKSVFFGGMADHTKIPVQDWDGAAFSPQRTANAFSSEEFANAARSFLTNHPAHQPFLCYVAFTAPHDPRNPPESFRNDYYKNPPPLPKNFLPLHPFDNGWIRDLRDENLAPYPRTPSVIRNQLAEYYGLVTHLDEQVGAILRTLRNSPFATNTYVIYAADSGLAVGSHGLLGKQSLYEHSMRCPLILSGPNLPQNAIRREFTYLLDLFPTLAELAHLPTPPDLHGKSLVPLLAPNLSNRSRSPSPFRTTVFLPFTDTMRSIRDERWKLIVYPQINHRQLFDLQKDPHECQNLADSPKHQPHLFRLLAQLKEAQTQAGDSLPLTSKNPKSPALNLDGYVRKPDAEQPEWIVKKYFKTGTNALGTKPAETPSR